MASGHFATILAIGTANPPNILYQNEYPDFYFRVTNSDHMTDLKAKFKRICEKSRIKKRYFHLNEEILRANPNICNYKAPSLDARQEMMKEEIPQLGKAAALKAIEEWGQPISKITHLIFCTSSCIHMPGPDYQLTKLLGLSPTIKRFTLFQHGCYASGSALRLAKDVAENNVGSRILVVCVDIMTMSFHAPSETRLDILVENAVISDGAAAMVIGAGPDTAFERPLFQIISASQAIIPDSEDGVVGEVSEMGLNYIFSPKIVQKQFGQFMKEYLVDAIPIEVCDYNSLFYVFHPGIPAVLDEIEEKLGLKENKLEASRKVFREYGNMTGPTVLFVLDETRKKSMEEGKSSTGGGSERGLLVCMGPGLTVEIIMLQSVPI